MGQLGQFRSIDYIVSSYLTFSDIPTGTQTALFLQVSVWQMPKVVKCLALSFLYNSWASMETLKDFGKQFLT